MPYASDGMPPLGRRRCPTAQLFIALIVLEVIGAAACDFGLE
jgi:hypothetical protein